MYDDNEALNIDLGLVTQLVSPDPYEGDGSVL